MIRDKRIRKTKQTYVSDKLLKSLKILLITLSITKLSGTKLSITLGNKS